MATIEMTFDDAHALAHEIDTNLSKGRTFVAGADGVEVCDACDLVLWHPESGQGLRLAAVAVWLQPEAPGNGVGLELPDVSLERLEAFARTGEGDPDLALPPGIAPMGDESGADLPLLASSKALDDAHMDQEEPISEHECEPAVSSGRLSSRATHDVRHINERVRHLSIREQVVMARGGNLTERIALERCYGAAVWENLLQNPQLTPPEVSRIAKKGTLPQPLVHLIVSNAAWLATPEVQRALLANPRVSGPALTKVLRALSRSELARVPQQTAYRSQVRDAAKKMLKA